jgi:hypothetical protein
MSSSYGRIPQVYLRGGANPWSATLSDADVLQFLLTAAEKGEERISQWIDNGDTDVDASFAQVFLDPTRARHQFTIVDRIFAIVIYGDAAVAFDYLPNAAAKADAADRHGCSNGTLVDEANFCLGDNDFTWGDTAFYKGAVSAGSGLKVAQDRELAQLTLESAMDAVHKARAAWLVARREVDSQSWFNGDNVPGKQYLFPVNFGDWLTPRRS